MSDIFIDLEFIDRISPSLKMFKKSSNNTFNFRCPYCGDSEISETKARGYFYEKSGKMLFRCHNCGHGTTLSKFMKEHNEADYKDYIIRKFNRVPKTRKDFMKANRKKKPLNTIPLQNTELEEYLSKKLSEHPLPENHTLIEYLKSRMIPSDRWTEIIYVEDINKLTKFIPKYADNEYKNLSPWLVFIFKDKYGIVTFLQARAIGNDVGKRFRFLTLEVIKDAQKVYNLDKVDDTKPKQIVEGIFDSMFLENSIAMAGADIDTNLINRKSDVIIFDNESNQQIHARMQNMIELGYKIVIWEDIPFQFNDINDMVIEYGVSYVRKYIEEHTFSGMKAKFKFLEYKKRKF